MEGNHGGIAPTQIILLFSNAANFYAETFMVADTVLDRCYPLATHSTSFAGLHDRLDGGE